MRTRLLLVVTAILWSGSLPGQTFSANLTGLVTDASGAAVPGAQAVLKDPATNDTRKTVANDQGRYAFSQIAPTTYTLTVTHSGFRQSVQGGLVLSPNQSAEVNVQLQVGSLSESVEITGAAPILDTQTSNESETLSTTMVESLPIANRAPLVLVLAAGAGGSYATTNGSSGPGANDDQNVARYNLFGQRQNSSAIMIDGIPSLVGDWGGLLAEPGTDTVQDLQVLRNTYEAQYGRSSAGVINMTTKGGTDKYHGTAFEYFRNNELNANTFFSNLTGTPITKSTRNEYGGNFSGPIWKQKRLYGFFGYDEAGYGQPGTLTTSLPTVLQRQGNFSQTFNANGSLQTIYDPATTVPTSTAGVYTRSVFPGNIIPVSRYDVIGNNYAALLPLPNYPGNSVTQANNYFNAGVSHYHSWHADMRGDFQPTDKLFIWGKVTKGRSDDEYGPNFWPAAVATYQPQHHPRIAISTGATYVWSPTTVVNVTVGGGRWFEQWPNPSLGFNYASLGFSPALASQFAIDTSPIVSLTNYSNFGSTRNLFLHRNNYNTQLNVTKNKGSHAIKFGFDYEDQQLNRSDQNSAFFGFTQAPTSGPNPSTNNGLTGNAFASLLLGAGSSGTALGVGVTGEAVLANNPATSDAYFAFYIQDAWKVTSHLTVNYGLRYEIQPAQTERFNDQDYFDPNAINPIGAAAGMPNLKGAIEFTNSSNRAPWNTDYHNLAPRLGLAYRVTDKFVIRAGAGITYTRVVPLYLNSPSNDGYETTTPWTTSLNGGITVANYWANAFPNGIQPISGSSEGALQQDGLAVNEFDRLRPTPYVQEYSTDLQYEVSRDTVAELGYNGSGGRKLIENGAYNANELPDKDLSLGNALLASVPNPFYGTPIASGTLSGATVQYGQLLLPYPQYTAVNLLITPGASSTFNALTAKITHRFSRSLTLVASYQWSKAIDNVSEDGSGTVHDYNNLSLDRSVSAHDIPQNVVLTYRYEFPFGKGKSFGSSWPRGLDLALGGWSVAGVFSYHSGYPLAFTTTNNTNSFGGTQFPDIADGAQLARPNPSRQEWFNTADVTQPPAFTFGNAPREVGYVRAAPMENVDMGLTKTFALPWEKVKLNFRADAFNAFNHNQFAVPNTSLGSTTFGQVTTSADNPRNIQLALRLTF